MRKEMEKMTQELAIREMEISRTTIENILIEKPKSSRWFLILVSSAASAIVCGVSGLILSGLAYFDVVENTSRFSRFGIWLIVVVFPLIMLMAHALDKIEAMQKEKKMAKKF